MPETFYGDHARQELDRLKNGDEIEVTMRLRGLTHFPRQEHHKIVLRGGKEFRKAHVDILRVVRRAPPSGPPNWPPKLGDVWEVSDGRVAVAVKNTAPATWNDRPLRWVFTDGSESMLVARDYADRADRCNWNLAYRREPS